jgi:hypothetical protein
LPLSKNLEYSWQKDINARLDSGRRASEENNTEMEKQNKLEN